MRKRESRLSIFRESDDPLLFPTAQYGDSDYDVISLCIDCRKRKQSDNI